MAIKFTKSILPLFHFTREFNLVWSWYSMIIDSYWCFNSDNNLTNNLKRKPFDDKNKSKVQSLHDSQWASSVKKAYSNHNATWNQGVRNSCHFRCPQRSLILSLWVIISHLKPRSGLKVVTITSILMIHRNDTLEAKMIMILQNY